MADNPYEEGPDGFCARANLEQLREGVRIVEDGLDRLEWVAQAFCGRFEQPEVYRNACVAYLQYLRDVDIAVGLALITLTTRKAKMSFIPIFKGADSIELHDAIGEKYRAHLFSLVCDLGTKKAYEEHRKEWDEDTKALEAEEAES